MNLRVAKRLHDALAAGRNIEQFVADRTLDDYLRDVYFRSAVERQFEILSEALKIAIAGSGDVGEALPESAQIIGMRNRIAHSYDVLDDTIVWGAATEHVPGLVSRLEGLLDDYPDPAALD